MLMKHSKVINMPIFLDPLTFLTTCLGFQKTTSFNKNWQTWAKKPSSVLPYDYVLCQTETNTDYSHYLPTQSLVLQRSI